MSPFAQSYKRPKICPVDEVKLAESVWESAKCKSITLKFYVVKWVDSVGDYGLYYTLWFYEMKLVKCVWQTASITLKFYVLKWADCGMETLWHTLHSLVLRGEASWECERLLCGAAHSSLTKVMLCECEKTSSGVHSLSWSRYQVFSLLISFSVLLSFPTCKSGKK